MKYQRKFIIKINDNSYVKNIVKNEIGYYYTITNIIENANVWKLKKNCQKAIDILLSNLDPTKKILSNNKLEVIEITDNQTLRRIKLYKISKIENKKQSKDN